MGWILEFRDGGLSMDFGFCVWCLGCSGVFVSFEVLVLFYRWF